MHFDNTSFPLPFPLPFALPLLFSLKGIPFNNVGRCNKPFPAAEGARLLQTFLTAYLELVMLGQLSKGQSVLIHAGASGVGMPMHL